MEHTKCTTGKLYDHTLFLQGYRGGNPYETGSPGKDGVLPDASDVVDRIRSFLRYPNENVNLPDPCCGEGLALKRLVDGGNATTYGIELHEHRAEQARRDERPVQCRQAGPTPEAQDTRSALASSVARVAIEAISNAE